MKSHLILTLVARLRSLSARRYSPIFAGSLLLLAAIVGWQLSARFVVAAKSRTAVSTASAAAAPEAGNMCCGTWTQKATTGPSQRYRDAMAYARNCNRVVLFGGLGNGPNPAGALDDTWEWDGTTMTWTQFSPAVKPPARGGHTMAYDSARNRVVLFGGLTGSFSVFNDTWEYNCSTHTWTQMNPANSPPGRFGHAMAYDPNLGVSVINGGQSTNQDTWTWNGTNWTQVAGGNQPGIRYDHGMAFDGLRVILFGGNKNAGLAANDTWGFTGTAWTQLAVTGPSQGERLGLAQDPAAGRVILFGGSNSISNYTNDTWEWNGANLTWCQATLTAPQPAGREYPAMAFDGRGVIFHAGLNSGLVTLADTWRYQGSRTYTFRAGLMDNFASPNDPTSPRAVLVTQFNNPVRKNFDDATVDSWVLHSFTGLPSNIVSAELEVRMQPGLGGSTNDSINFAFPPNTSVTWGQQMAALPGAGGSWNIGHAPTTFILDLANLPAGATGQPTNLLSLLNTHHLLDIAIQDDTTVDYIKLRVVTCPPRRYFAGFPHEPFNDTTLSLLTSPTGVEQLQVNPSPTGRTDVKTVLGQVAGWRADLLPTTDLRQPGRVMESWVKGRVNGVDDQFIGKSSITGNGSSATFMADFSNIGSPTSLVELLDPNGLLVGSFTAPNAAAIQFMCPTGTQTITTCTTQWVCEPNGDKTQVTFCNTICVSYNNQSYNNVSTMRVTALNITQPREFVSEGVICGVNLGGLTLTGESLIVGGRPVQSLGIASLEPFASGIAVEGAGSSGQDGAQIDLGMAENYTVSIDTIDPMNIAAVGTALTVSTTHVSTVLPPPPPKDDAISVTRVRPDDSLPTGIIEIAADFSQLGANSMRVTAFNGATQVADMTNFTGKVLTSAWPVAMGKIGSTSLGYKLDFPSGTLAAFRPCSPPCDQQFTITSLQVLPTNPNVGTAYFRQNRWTFSPGGISGFTVTGLAITPFCNSTITLSPTSLAVAAVNQPYSQQLTASGGVAPYRFSVTAGALNAGLSLDSLTGVISGTPTSTTPATFTVTATDDNGCTGSRQYTLTPIVCPTITVNPATPTLPPGQVGSPYSQQFSQSGGAGLPFWTISAGALPGGLTLNSISGLLSGTPTAPGTFNFTVTATDSSGCPGTRVYTLVIGCPVVTVNPVTLPNGFVGTAYNQTFTTTGGAGPYSFTRVTGTLPPGLTLATSGALTGTPTAAETYNFTVQATDAAGCTGTRAYTVAIGGSGLMFYPLDAPVRILDTRPGLSACSQPNAPIAAGIARVQPARGFCGIPATAQAITGNVTTVNSGGGFLTLYPTGAARPVVASTNYGPNEVINNVFTVGLGVADGAFNIYALNTTDVVVDVTGYYAPPGTGGLYFHPLPSPVRFLETRQGPLAGCLRPGVPLAADSETTYTAPSACTGIPAAARAVVGNATTVSPQTGGFLTLFPTGVPRPLVASSNYGADQVVNGPFTVGLSVSGQFKIYTLAQTHLVVDVLGYYSPEATDANGAGLLFTPLDHPVRLFESRAGQTVGCFRPGEPLNGNQTYTQPARGLCDGLTIPPGALGVVGNATTVSPASGGFLTLWPSAATQPTVATANYGANQVVNRHFIVGLGNTDGAFKMLSFATTHLVIDLVGYFAP